MTQLTKLGLFGAPSEQYVASPKRAPGTITKSIGTSSRDYSTISLWEADLDDATIYVSGDDAVGECYNDSDFNESVTIDGGSTAGLNSIKLTAPVSERHDGTAGNGAKNKWSSGTHCILVTTSIQSVTISWLEIDGSQNSTPSYGIRSSVASNTTTLFANNNIIHDLVTSTFGSQRIYAIEATDDSYIHNNFIYKLSNDEPAGGSDFVTGIQLSGSVGNVDIAYNNTIHNLFCPGTGTSERSTGISSGVIYADDFIKNNLITDIRIAEGSILFPEALNLGRIDFAGNVSNNATSLSSIDGSNSLTFINISNQYISIVDGTEDLHLKSGADAIGAAVDLGTSSAGVQYDIDGQDRDLFSSILWDIGADQRTTPKTIGTAARDYSTITAWEADLDSITVYTNGDDAVGECYNDSDFNESVTIDGGSTIGLNSIKLTAPTSERHDGTAGTGVRLLYNTGTSLGTKLTLANSSDQSIIEWLDFDANNLSIKNLVSVYNSSSGLSTIRNSLIHNIKKTSQATTGLDVGSYGQAHNCLVYNIEHTSTNSFLTDVYGIDQSFNTSLYNNTVYNVKNAATSNCRGIYQRSTGTDNRNNISVASDDVDFFGSAATEDYNLSSDTTANGANSLTNKSAANQFVSIVSGSEDLHLKGGSDALNNGVDLGTSPDNIQYDIDGYDRGLSNTWDIGADEASSFDGSFGFSGLGGSSVMLLGVG